MVALVACIESFAFSPPECRSGLGIRPPFEALRWIAGRRAVPLPENRAIVRAFALTRISYRTRGSRDGGSDTNHRLNPRIHHTIAGERYSIDSTRSVSVQITSRQSMISSLGHHAMDIEYLQLR